MFDAPMRKKNLRLGQEKSWVVFGCRSIGKNEVAGIAQSMCFLRQQLSRRVELKSRRDGSARHQHENRSNRGTRFVADLAPPNVNVPDSKPCPHDPPRTPTSSAACQWAVPFNWCRVWDIRSETTFQNQSFQFDCRRSKVLVPCRV